MTTNCTVIELEEYKRANHRDCFYDVPVNDETFEHSTVLNISIFSENSCSMLLMLIIVDSSEQNKFKFTLTAAPQYKERCK